MSKEGRFYCVHFTTGATVDVVPPGSLASGMDGVGDATLDAGKPDGGLCHRTLTGSGRNTRPTKTDDIAARSVRLRVHVFSGFELSAAMRAAYNLTAVIAFL